MPEAITVRAGRTARERLASEGWSPALFDTLVGASGGPKFLGIAGLDRFLFGDFLMRGDQALHLIGSSIGCWRHAALAARDPLKSLAVLVKRYTEQYYDPEDKRSRVEQVGELCRWVVDGFMSDEDIAYLCDHPRFITHVVTARGRGPNSARGAVPQATGMFLAGLSNALNRNLLQSWFQRVVFSCRGYEDLDFEFEDFTTLHIPLSADNAREALLASASIPFLMPGERDISGGPPGHYWDGGIVDYHFDFSNHRGDGLVLYPHFRGDVTPGWFDKFLPWRGTDPALLDRVVLVYPSAEYLSRLPRGKIPDRNDFPKMTHDERVDYWRACELASDELGDAFAGLVDGPDPLAGVLSFEDL